MCKILVLLMAFLIALSLVKDSESKILCQIPSLGNMKQFDVDCLKYSTITRYGKRGYPEVNPEDLERSNLSREKSLNNYLNSILNGYQNDY